HEEVVNMIRARSLGEISIDDEPGKVRAILRNTVVMADIGDGIVLRDQAEVLLQGGLYLKKIDLAGKSSGHHIAPVRARANATGRPGADIAKTSLPESVLQRPAEARRRKDRPVVFVLHAVKKNVERHHIPLIGLDLVERSVVTED